MNVNRLQLHLPLSVDAKSSSEIALLPEFPPSNDQPITYNERIEPVSNYGDDTWDNSAIGWPVIDFRRLGLNKINTEFVKRLYAIVLFHPKYWPGKYESCLIYIRVINVLAKVCQKHDARLSEFNGLVELHDEAVEILSCNVHKPYTSAMRKLSNATEIVGFTLVDYKFVKYFDASNDESIIIQHPYIPPRIWIYIVRRMSEFLDEFLVNRSNIEKYYYEYIENYAPLSSPKKSDYRHKYSIRTYGDFLQRYSLRELMVKWFGTHVCEVSTKYGFLNLKNYMCAVRDTALWYIGCFSLQRKEELTSLMSDCFKIENDPKIGKMCFVVGETTKTVTDSDARWVVPSNVEKAVVAATVVADLTLSHAPDEYRSKLVSPDGATRLYVPDKLVAQRVKSPPSRDMLRRLASNFGYLEIKRRVPLLFDQSEICVNKDDRRIALTLTPNLNYKKWFGLGKPWHFTTHQLRRTLAVNIHSSELVSDESLQGQMQHQKVEMTLRYARYSSKLVTNGTASKVFIYEAYKAIGSKLTETLTSHDRYVNPHNKETVSSIIVNLISAKDYNQITKLVEQGKVSVRENQIGLCMSPDDCPYGGIESIAQCTGVQSGGICSDLRIDKLKRSSLIDLKDGHEQELLSRHKDSPRAGFLRNEIYGIEIALNATKK